MPALLSKLRFAPPAAQVPGNVQSESQSLAGAGIAAAFFPSRMGGDFHDFYRVGPHRFLFGLLDVAGKREDNLSVLQSAKACFHASGTELLSRDEFNEPEAMIELSHRLNLEILRAAGGVRSCPAFAGCYNEELHTVCYVNAGHTPGLLRDGFGTVELPATGLPLGLFPLATTDAQIVGLGTRASLVVVSRGAVEAESKRREFSLDGVKQLMEAPSPSAEALAQRILQAVQEFVQPKPQRNDVTALALSRKD